MAMNDNGGILTMINDLVDDVVGEQTITQKKSNTVVATVGGIITMLIAGGSYLVESETTLPSWFPLVMTALGVIGTVFKISKTKNGMTTSVAATLQDAISQKIDLAHFNELNTEAARPVQAPQYQQTQPQTNLHPIDQALDLREVAEGILNNVVRR